MKTSNENRRAFKVLAGNYISEEDLEGLGISADWHLYLSPTEPPSAAQCNRLMNAYALSACPCCGGMATIIGTLKTCEWSAICTMCGLETAHMMQPKDAASAWNSRYAPDTAGDDFAALSDAAKDRLGVPFPAQPASQQGEGEAVAVVGVTGYPMWLVNWLNSPEWKQLPHGTKLYAHPPAQAATQGDHNIAHYGTTGASVGPQPERPQGGVVDMAMVEEGLRYFELAGDAGDKVYVAEIRKALATPQPAPAVGETVAERSLFAWFIAKLHLEVGNYDKPEVGDWAVEVTTLIQSRRDGLHWNSAIGEVIAADHDKCEYVLRLSDRTTQRWENAMMRKLPKPHHITPPQPVAGKEGERG